MRSNLMTRRRNGMIRDPILVLQAAGRAMSEWELMRACYGMETDIQRRGNGGRVMGVRLAMRRLNGVIHHVGTNGANMWSLK